ncbi:MAG: DUF1016 N-terminal domain-containing protein [Candidatus Kapabacteria bacterium]|nr:DUF1016 N-terminal domain-containing protein [Candidatus Kapabacteria bacterium]
MLKKSIISDIEGIINLSRENAIRAVDRERTLMYWHIGQRIFEEVQQGQDRAKYGEYLTKYISEQIEPEYGSGFSRRQIELSRQFYRIFPIANTLYSQLNWSQYKLLIRMDNGDKREFYLAEAVKNDAVVKFTLPEEKNNILASKYQLYLPTEKQLLEELKKEFENPSFNKIGNNEKLTDAKQYYENI